MQDGNNETRPKTPESPLASSLYHASSTIDDLAISLANFPRLPSPEPPFSVTCCCGKDECDNTKAWLTLKSNLESRLVLSAEVGQALLQRHEAYVRKHEACHARDSSGNDTQVEPTESLLATQDQADARIGELLQEKALLEKRLNHALVNNEVAEVSNKTVLHELHEARETISRLTAYHVRSVGWDTRLAAVLQERDDMQQERDVEAHKARQAESRTVSLRTRTAKLEAEVQRLQRDLEEKRLHRLESSESILQDARARLEALQHSQVGRTAMIEETEIMKVLESLVEDNEGLKRDNAELQHLLTESREDYHALREEMEEQRANRPSHSGTPHLKSLFLAASGLAPPHSRNSSLDGRRRSPSESQPEADRRDRRISLQSLSPLSSETRWAAFAQDLDSHTNVAIDGEGESDTNRPSVEKAPPHKPLFLLSRSRGVQTDPLPEPSPHQLSIPMSSLSPHDLRSESSSLTDSPASNMSVLVERVVSLLQRMTQSDALTLTNRLKRQHLKGADVGHLSRTTVGGIVSEISGLRTQFRALLEDDKVVTTCTRKDLRALLKLFKDVFVEMGEMRVTLNDVILDPSIASKVREMALNSTKADHPTTGGWMAPISKLFGTSPGEGPAVVHDAAPVHPKDTRGRPSSRPRVVPKLGPALSASTTTVNVEFSSSGVGRAVTSTLKAREGDMNNALVTAASNPSYRTSTNVMGIFAGAPRHDPWVVLPQGAVESPPPSSSLLSPPPFGKPRPRNVEGTHRLSRHVDAVIDASSPTREGGDADHVAPLLQRTLRHRGLSDSSIHSTFISQAVDESRLISPVGMIDGARPDRVSVLQALGRTVKNFRISPSGPEIQYNVDAGSDASGPSQNLNVPGSTDSVPSDGNRPRIPSPLGSLLPNFSSWTSSSPGLDTRQPLHTGTPHKTRTPW